MVMLSDEWDAHGREEGTRALLENLSREVTR